MPVRQLEVQRFSLVSSKPFDEVVKTVSASVGHPEMETFRNQLMAASTETELEQIVGDAVSSIELMEFYQLDAGMVMQKELGPAAPKSIRFLIGNPVIMKTMAKQIPDAASYAPVTILVDERQDGVHISYDTMASCLATYGSAEASRIAEDLDNKVRSLMTLAAG